MSVSRIQVRLMSGEDDAETIYSICKENSLRAVRRDDIIEKHRFNQGKLLIAETQTGQIKGVCFILVVGGNTAVINGFAVSSDCPNPELIRQALFTEATNVSRNMAIEVTVPEAMCEYIERKKYTLRWNIYAYISDVTRINLPERKNYDYRVIVNNKSYGAPFNLHYTTSHGEKTMFFPAVTHVPIASVKVYVENHIKVIGYGVVNANDEREWIIGPIVASDENVVKLLLSEMVSFVKNKSTTLRVIMHAISQTDMTWDFLKEAGFTRLAPKWGRYSERKDNDEVYDRLDHILFALKCPFFSFT